MLTLFLFVGIIATVSSIINEEPVFSKNLTIHTIEHKTERISIKEIESISANNNFTFTSKNALK